eukprot:6636954-Alexandrium_andersonii.AAC.2
MTDKGERSREGGELVRPGRLRCLKEGELDTVSLRGTTPDSAWDALDATLVRDAEREGRDLRVTCLLLNWRAAGGCGGGPGTRDGGGGLSLIHI